MSISRATKYSQLRVISRWTELDLKKIFALNSCRWRSINQEIGCINCFTPEILFQSWMWELASCFVTEHYVHAFCNTILLWCPCTSAMSHCTFIAAECIELTIVKFQPVISSKTLDLLLCLLLNHRLPLYKGWKCLIFFFLESTPTPSESNHQWKSWSTWHHSWKRFC